MPSEKIVEQNEKMSKQAIKSHHGQYDRFSILHQNICLLCHANEVDAICDDCLQDLCVLRYDGSRHCPYCGGVGDGISRCGRCLKKMHTFEKLWSSLLYEPPLIGILHEFKHQNRPVFARLLAKLMTQLPPPWLNNTPFDAVLAMPLSWQRRLHRGFNQCDELVGHLAKYYDWQVLPINSVFRRHTVPQSTLKFTDRRKNIIGIFNIENLYEINRLLLIDDVVTTNATISELSRVLKNKGVQEVFCWTLCTAAKYKP